MSPGGTQPIGPASAARTRATSEAIEFRRNLLRSFKLAFIAWSLFFLFDLYLRATMFPNASLRWLIAWRVAGLAATIPVFMTGRSSTTSMPVLLASVSIGFSITVGAMAMIATELGGLQSTYVHGTAFFFAGISAMLPQPPRRALALMAPILLTYPAVMALAALGNPALAAQWHSTTGQATMMSNCLFQAGLLAFAVVTSHLLWASRRQLYEARRLGRYRLKSPLGEGGMNEVWLAFDDTLGRDVALKILRNRGDGDLAAVKRFEREAHATSALTSPHTVRLYDYGASDDGIAYIAMEHLIGLDLDAITRAHGPLPVARAVHFARQACLSLAEAHQRDLVHRDVKPANLMALSRAGEEDFLKVLDFGVVRQLGGDSAGATLLTQEGAAIGTPAFMSPEAFLAGEVTARSDVYSLGATLYFLLTGTAPFEGEDPSKLWLAHARTAVVPVGQRRGEPVPAALEELMQRCLDKDPARRYATGGELGAALASMADVPAWSADDARVWWSTARGGASAGPPSGRNRNDVATVAGQR